tara:strand:+ start:1023 stop:2096 length:1074 start_codon:yes stop_codon:yes gene_type:complete
MAFSLGKIFSNIGKSDTELNRVVGIDVGSSSVKVTELEQTERALTLKTYGELQLGPYANKELGEVVHLEQKQEIEALVDVFREAGVKAKKGVLSMPLSAGFITVIPVAVDSDDALENRIPVEARKYIPVNINDITLDWLPLNLKPINNQQEVLIVAMQNDSVDRFGDLIRSINVATEGPELEVFSAIRACSDGTNDPFAIIDLGAWVSKLYIVRNNSLERIHRVTTGGATITAKLAELKQMSFTDAENFKRTVSDDTALQDIRRTSMSVLSAPLQEFRRLIEQYESRIGTQIKYVSLTGGVSNTINITPFIRETLSRDAKLSHPFSKVAYPAFMEDTIKTIGPAFATSVGAALRDFY